MGETFERVLAQPGVRGLYESHYLKANSPDGRQALWLKYCLLCPLEGPRVAELWGVVWRSPSDAVVVKQTLPADEFALGLDRIEVRHVGGAGGPAIAFDATRATAALDDGAHRLAWDLRIAASEAPILHYPLAAMYTAALPKSKMMTPAPRAVFDGSLTVDGEVLDVRGWVGLRGHNWGREHAHHYAYGNCSLWDDDGGLPGLHVDGFSAQVRLGPLTTPFLSAVVVRSGGNDLAFNGLRALATRQVSVTFPRWWVAAELSGRSGDVALELAMEADPATFVGLRYLHPKGGTSCCYNSKFASVRLTLRGPDGVATARSHLGELEILSRQPVPGLALHGNAAPLALDRRPRPAAGSRAHASPQPETRA